MRLPHAFVGAVCLGFALANLAMLASPMFLWVFGHDLRLIRRIAAILAAATIYVALYPITNLASVCTIGIGDLCVAYYA